MLASEGFVRKHGLENKAVEIIAQEMVTDLSTTFEENSCIKMVGGACGSYVYSRIHANYLTKQSVCFFIAKQPHLQFKSGLGNTNTYDFSFA